LINRFAEQNYRFGLFSSIGFLHPEFLQSSFSQINNEELKHYSTVNNNPTTTRKWQKWIAQQDDKLDWFSFLYYELEDKPNSKGKTAFTLAARTEKLSRYQQQVLSIDKQIQKVISTLQASQQFDNTIVLITGTHGASFEKKSSVEATLNNAHVPLVLLWPGEGTGVVTRMTSHVDIVPTLMEKLFGSQTNAVQYSSGQSLFDDKPRQYLLSGDLDKYVIYESDKITQFSNDGQINSINWHGERLADEEVNITLLIDVLSKLRRFNSH
jgi:hypothetical protein